MCSGTYWSFLMFIKKNPWWMHRSVVIDSKINDCWIVLDGSRIQAELKMPFNLELKASLLGTHVPLTFSITHQKHCVYWPFVKPRSMDPGEIVWKCAIISAVKLYCLSPSFSLDECWHKPIRSDWAMFHHANMQR